MLCADGLMIQGGSTHAIRLEGVVGRWEKRKIWAKVCEMRCCQSYATATRVAPPGVDPTAVARAAEDATAAQAAAGAAPGFDAAKAEADIANNANEVLELKRKVGQLLVRVAVLEQASPP